MTDPSTWPAYCGSMTQAAAIMGISKGVLRMAKARGAPGFVDSRVRPKVVAEWLEKHAATPTAPPDAGNTPPARPDSSPHRRSLPEEIADLDDMLARVDALARSTLASGDVTTALQLLDQRKPLSDQRNNAMTQARRAGRTEDEVIARAEVERIVHAIAHHACVGLQAVAVDIVRAIEGETDPTRQLPLVESALVPSVLAAPMEQAGKLAAGHGLPSWAVDCITKAVREVVR